LRIAAEASGFLADEFFGNGLAVDQVRHSYLLMGPAMTGG
jgi:hypothetical protein